LLLPHDSRNTFGTPYFCNFRTGLGKAQLKKRGCTQYKDDPKVLPNGGVEKEFSDDTGKHFVLLKWGYLHMGVDAEGYAVFYLTSRSNTTQDYPFAIDYLTDDSSSDDGLDQDDACGMVDAEKGKSHDLHTLVDTVNDIDKYTIGHDEAGYADIQFKVTEEDCDNDKVRDYIGEYVFKQGRFQEMKTGFSKFRKPSLKSAQ
jgi:hypothetical protein